MRIRDVMTKNPITVDSETLVLDAQKVMQNNSCGPYASKSVLHAPEWKCRLWLPHHLVTSLEPSSL